MNPPYAAHRPPGSFGNAQATDYDRWQSTRDYVMSRNDEYIEVLTAA